MFLLSENPWQEDNFQSYGEIESNIRFEFYGGTIVADKIQNAYHDSKNIYDGVLTQGNIFSKLYIKLFWSGTDDNEIARKVLSYIPNDFDGELLDVPVGTAVFTEAKWEALANAKITCLDYSEDMLAQAQARLAECQHISFIQGDVGNLPMEDETYDIVVSMNGFHAFPDTIYNLLKKKEFRWIQLDGGKYRIFKKSFDDGLDNLEQ